MDRDKIIKDLSSHININKAFLTWMTGLGVLLFVCLGAYYEQLTKGLQVTGLGDYVSWGIYLANFVFFVAVSLIGMLISSVLILSGQHWAKPLSRIAEVIAVAFAAIAGLVIISDMGMPHRVGYLFMHGRIQSPILWDVIVVNTYFLFSLLLFYVPMIPDLAILSDKFTGKYKIFNKIYKLLSIGYVGNSKQKAIIVKVTKLLSIVIIPLAFAIHTVTSWIFAVTTRSGWDSTVFGPYFISGAFVAGAAAVIILMFIIERTHKLQNYIREEHYNKMGKLLLIVSMLYLYFNINEYFIPFYTSKKADSIHIQELFYGKDAFMFWFVQIACLLLPAILLFIKKARTSKPLLFISVFVLMGAWLKRYLIVVPTQEHPFLPIQNVPESFKHYSVTIPEVLITIAPIIMAVMIISLLLKFFPVIPISEEIETIEEKNK
jgi:molybdopterin-containing oxidoreductase family membrane subunit